MADEHDDHGSHGGGGHGGGHGGGGHGGGGHEEHEGAPEWLISFADNVALMMGFFVVLLAMNMKPASSGSTSSDQPSDTSANSASPEMMDLAIGIREAFNNPVSSKNPNDVMLYRRVMEREAEAAAHKPGKHGKEDEVESIRPSNYHGLGGTILFERNSAVLDEAGHDTFAQLLRQRRGSRNIVRVRGHVSAAEAFGQPDRAMSLAVERAMLVAKMLVDGGLDARQVQVEACADSDRITARAFDEAGQRSNQRVELIETDKPLQEYDSDDEPAEPAQRTKGGGESEKHGAGPASSESRHSESKPAEKPKSGEHR